MRRYLGFSLVLALLMVNLLNSCRQENLRELPDHAILNDYPSHCSNNILDADEVGYDCGGSCPDCNQVTAPCTVESNHVSYTRIIDGLVFGTQNVEFTSVICGHNLDGEAYIRGNFGPDYIRITVPVSEFTSRTWQLASGLAFFDEAGIEYYHNGYMHYSTGGEIYVNVNGPQVRVDLCSASVYGMEGFLEVFYSVVGNVTCE